MELIKTKRDFYKIILRLLHNSLKGEYGVNRRTDCLY